MSKALYKALAELDVGNDDHWTEAGLPSIDALSEKMGARITRDAVRDATKTFNRSNPVLDDSLHTSVAGIHGVPDKVEGELASESALEKATKARDDAQEKVREAQAKLFAAQTDLDAELIKVEIDRMREPAGSDIKAYLNSQNKARADRAASTASALAALSAK